MLGSDYPVRLAIFDGPRLLVEGRDVRLSPLHAQLLAVVYGAGPQGVSRPEAAWLLWEDDDGSAIRHRLSQLLYDARRKIGWGLVEPLGDRLVGSNRVWTDVAQIRAAAAVRNFTGVRSLLGGEFGSLLTRSTASLQHWRDATAAGIRRDISDAAAAAWSAAEHEERWEDALSAAEVLRTLQPEDPDLLGRVVELQMSLGRIHEAQQGLRRLGSLAPGMQEDIETRIRQIQDRAPDPDQTLPLFGRTTELTRIVTKLSAPHSAPVFAFVVGEPGIGKTRLCDEALWRCETRGTAVLRSRCGSFDRSIPLNPLVEALSSSATTPFVRRLQEPWRSVILSLMPVHAPSPGEVEPPPEISSGSVPRRLFEAFFRLFQHIVQDRPTVLFIDDVQWIDETSLAVIDFLASRASAGHLRILLAARPDHLRSMGTPAARFMLRRKAQNSLWIDLAELDGGASGELVAAVGGGRLDAGTAATIERRAAGHPFLLVELALHQLRPRDGAERASLPTSIEHLVLERISRTSPDLQALLQRLSTTGSLAVEELPLLLEWPLSRTLRAVDEGIDHLLLVDRRDVIDVKHALISEVVRGNLTPGARAALHLSAAEHLRREGKAHSGQLALHYELAGRNEEACTHALRAADRAEADGAVAEAIGFLEIAKRTATTPDLRRQVLGQLAHLYYRHSNYSVSAALAEEAARELRKAGQLREGDLLDVERFGALSEIGTLAQEECLKSIESIVDGAHRDRDRELMIRACEEKVRILQRMERPQEVRKVLQLVEELKDTGSLEARVRARALLALNIYYGEVESAILAAEEGLELSSESGSEGLHALSRTRWIIVAICQGRLNLPEHGDVLRSWVDQARRTGDLRLWHSALGNAGVWYTDVGELDRAKGLLEQAQAVLVGSEAPRQHLVQSVNLGHLYWAMGEVSTAQQHFMRAEGQMRTGWVGLANHFIQAGLGLCALESGRLRDARSHERQCPHLRSWHFDPTTVLLLRAGLRRAEGNLAGAIAVLEEGATSIEGRMVPHWLTLQSARVRLMRRTDREAAGGIARECLDVAERLHLARRAQEFRALT